MGDKFHLHGKTPSGDFLLSVNDGPIEEVSPTMLSLMRKEEEEWQSFRREAAKDFICAMLQDTRISYSQAYEWFCQQALELADELIKQIKEEQK